jgi:hypothetical protein
MARPLIFPSHVPTRSSRRTDNPRLRGGGAYTSLGIDLGLTSHYLTLALPVCINGPTAPLGSIGVCNFGDLCMPGQEENFLYIWGIIPGIYIEAS